MSVISIILMGIRSLSVLNSNPALGGGGLRRDETSDLLNTLADLIEGGQETNTALKEFAAQIAHMAENNVQPTPSQIAGLKDRSDAAHHRLQLAKARLDGDDEEEVIQNLEDLSGEELVALADAQGIDVGDSREDLIAQLRASQAE